MKKYINPELNVTMFDNKIATSASTGYVQGLQDQNIEKAQVAFKKMTTLVKFEF